MTREELEEILNKANAFSDMSKSYILIGLNIIEKYTPGFNIEPRHDIIYAGDIDSILQAGLTIEDADELRKQNWMFDDEYDCLSVFT